MELDTFLFNFILETSSPSRTYRRQSTYILSLFFLLILLLLVISWGIQIWYKNFMLTRRQTWRRIKPLITRFHHASQGDENYCEENLLISSKKNLNPVNDMNRIESIENSHSEEYPKEPDPGSPKKWTASWWNLIFCDTIFIVCANRFCTAIWKFVHSPFGIIKHLGARTCTIEWS